MSKQLARLQLVERGRRVPLRHEGRSEVSERAPSDEDEKELKREQDCNIIQGARPAAADDIVLLLLPQDWSQCCC